jgi:hypothetical protein
MGRTVDSEDWKAVREHGLDSKSNTCGSCNGKGVFKDAGDIYTCDDCEDGEILFDGFQDGTVHEEDLVDLIEAASNIVDSLLDDDFDEEEDGVFYVIHVLGDVGGENYDGKNTTKE